MTQCKGIEGALHALASVRYGVSQGKQEKPGKRKTDERAPVGESHGSEGTLAKVKHQKEIRVEVASSQWATLPIVCLFRIPLGSSSADVTTPINRRLTLPRKAFSTMNLLFSARKSRLPSYSSSRAPDTAKPLIPKNLFHHQAPSRVVLPHRSPHFEPIRSLINSRTFSFSSISRQTSAQAPTATQYGYRWSSPPESVAPRQLFFFPPLAHAGTKSRLCNTESPPTTVPAFSRILHSEDQNWCYFIPAPN